MQKLFNEKGRVIRDNIPGVRRMIVPDIGIFYIPGDGYSVISFNNANMQAINFARTKDELLQLLDELVTFAS